MIGSTRLRNTTDTERSPRPANTSPKMSGSQSDKSDPAARLLEDITNTLPSRMHIVQDSGTELYRQRSSKEMQKMQNPILKRVSSGPQSQNSRRSANGYMPVRLTVAMKLSR
jgi:hypothetical protein